MGRKLDLSSLTEEEAEHVLQVVQRDMKLRRKEEERLSELKQELDEEGSRCALLSKRDHFNERCCIRCCSSFSFLLNPKRLCRDCRFNVCKGCRSYSKEDCAWLCTACQKSRILRTRSLEWYYNNVKSRFKRFGSAKVLKTLYRKHVAEQGTLLELAEDSVQEGSFDNEGSFCGSDSTFCRQSEGHSMAETLTVALRVAEEAIDEAIAKAEEYSDSLEKQNEARYLQDNKEDLIHELATTIVHKIIQRRKRSGKQTEYEMVWPSAQNTRFPSPTESQQSPPAFRATLRTSYSLSRSQSAFSLTSDESPEKPTESAHRARCPGGALRGVQKYASLKKDTKAPPMANWRSMDRLDNSCASSMLQSLDGNWIALQSTQLSRPSLLTKQKSQAFSALEKESGVVSAYDELGFDSDDEGDDTGGGGGGWGAALRQFRWSLSDETYYTDSQHDPEWTYTRHAPVASPSSGQYTNTETLNSESETSSTPPGGQGGSGREVEGEVARPKPPRSLLAFSKKAAAPPHDPRPHLHHSQDTLDVNFNPRLDSSEAEDAQSDPVRRARRRKKNRRDQADQARTQPARDPPAVPEWSSSLLTSSMPRRETKEDTMTPGPVPTSTPNSNAAAPPDSLKLELKTKLCRLARSNKELNSSEEDLTKGGGERGGRREEEVKESQHEIMEHRPKEKRGEWLGEKEGEVQGERLPQEGESEDKRQGERALKAENRATITSEKSATFLPEDCPSAEKIHQKGQNGLDLQQEGLQFLSSILQQKHSASSLCSLTTEVLKVLNATEELIEEAAGESHTDPGPIGNDPNARRLDDHLSKLEENVYLAAGAVYGLEGELGALEESARAVRSISTEEELARLEEQVASAAAQVQQSELQISDIEARISALKTAGLNVAPCTRFPKFKPTPKPHTIGSSRQQRRKLPAPPVKGKEFEADLKFRAMQP